MRCFKINCFRLHDYISVNHNLSQCSINCANLNLYSGPEEDFAQGRTLKLNLYCPSRSHDGHLPTKWSVLILSPSYKIILQSINRLSSLYRDTCQTRTKQTQSVGSSLPRLTFRWSDPIQTLSSLCSQEERYYLLAFSSLFYGQVKVSWFQVHFPSRLP